MPGWYITSNDFVHWTNTAKREAESGLPNLVRNLIKASVNPVELSVPSGNDISLPGLDGLVKVEQSSNRFVPMGISIWEIGTNVNPKSKADDDYAKRAEQDILGLRKEEITFVFVTSRKWSAKQKWAAVKNAEKIWAKVQVIDAVDLAEWIEECPAVHRWFARKLGKLSGARSSWDWAYAWDSWSKTTTPNYSIELAIAGRSQQVKELTDRIYGQPSVTRVSAASNEDAYGFVLSALATIPEFLPRAIIVCGEDGWHELLVERKTGPLILINCCDKELNHGYAVERGHQVIVLSSAFNKANSEIKLPVPKKRVQIDALRAMGIEDRKAENIIRSSRGRTTLIRRHKDMNPKELKQPEWANAEYANIIIPAIFAEAWSSTMPTDCQALAQLANMDCEQFEEKLVQLAREIDDPPVRLMGGVWTIVSRQDAFMHVRPFISSGFIKRLCSVATQVLQENDPRFELPLQERWMSLEYPKYSNSIARGISTALAMVVHEFDEEYLIGSVPIEEYVTTTISRIFGDSPDARRWYSLRNYLPALAEASSEVFLTRLEMDLQKERPEVADLFIGEGNLGEFPHANLLWALELISWNTRFFTRTIHAFAVLCKIKLSDRIGNRPFDSLRTIFKPWKPQTLLSPSERLQTIEFVYRSEPSIMWKLLLDMLPKLNDHSCPIHRPKYADWCKDEQIEVTDEEWDEIVCFIHKSILAKVNEIPEKRWPELLETIQSFDETFTENMLDCLEQVQWNQDNPKSVRKLSEVLYKKILDHRHFCDADWAFPESYIARLENFHLRLIGDDVLAKYGYLFKWGLPYIAGVEDYNEQDKIVTTMRITAVEEIWQQEGADGICELIYESEAYTVLADSLVKCRFANSIDETMFRWLFVSDVDCKKVVGEYIYRRGFNNPEWVNEQYRSIVCQWDDYKQAQFFAVLPYQVASTYFEKLAPSSKEYYWEVMEPAGVDMQNKMQITLLVDNLINHGRISVAARLVKNVLYFSKSITFIDDQIILNILQTITTDETPDFDAAMSLFEFLQKQAQLPHDKMASLEWNYLPILKSRCISPCALIKEVMKNPSFFVQLLRFMYHPSIKLEEPDLNISNRDELSIRADSLLKFLNRVPGQNDSGINKDQLLAWIDGVRAEACRVYRTKTVDYYIGELLALAPKGADGIWPNEIVRDIIELFQNSDIERGLLIKQFNQRGITVRGVLDGGSQEKNLSKKYALDAENIKKKWPRTAQLLTQISEGYLNDAKKMDWEAELTELRFY